jgi:hypothetical protein
MERGALFAFDRHHPQQRVACRRMLRYTAIIRWLYARAARADEQMAAAFREQCVGKPWPYGGIDDGDEPFFRLIASERYEDVTGVYAWPA